MKKLIALLLAVCMLLTFAACNNQPDNPGTSDPANDPKPSQSDPKPSETDPQPSETEPRFPDGRIVIEAEKPTDKYVDLVDRVDVGGNPMYQPGNQPHSARPIAEDGLQYCTRSTTCITFCSYDWYTYTFEVEKAGTYTFGVLGSCDRDSPIVYYLDGAAEAAGTGYFQMNQYQGYIEVDMVEIELTAGTHTIKVAIEEQKNHNFWVDCWYLKPVTE